MQHMTVHYYYFKLLHTYKPRSRAIFSVQVHSYQIEQWETQLQSTPHSYSQVYFYGTCGLVLYVCIIHLEAQM